jgi:hypothetical protein
MPGYRACDLSMRPVNRSPKEKCGAASRRQWVDRFYLDRLTDRAIAPVRRAKIAWGKKEDRHRVAGWTPGVASTDCIGGGGGNRTADREKSLPAPQYPHQYPQCGDPTTALGECQD